MVRWRSSPAATPEYASEHLLLYLSMGLRDFPCRGGRKGMVRLSDQLETLDAEPILFRRCRFVLTFAQAPGSEGLSSGPRVIGMGTKLT